MTISLYIPNTFSDDEYFMKCMDIIFFKYPQINKCLVVRSKSTAYAKKYFDDKNIPCEQPETKIHYKIQKLYKTVDTADLNIIFYDGNPLNKQSLAEKLIKHAEKYNRNNIIFYYTFK